MHRDLHVPAPAIVDPLVWGTGWGGLLLKAESVMY